MGGAKMLIIVFILAAIFLALFGVAFVSIVWTYRPDLSVLDILREVVKEIKKKDR